MSDLLRKLTEADAIASHEYEIEKIILQYAKKRNLKIHRDGLGSIALFKKGKNPSSNIGFFAHMDEVGFMVKHISPEGMAIVIPIGSVRENAKNAQKVQLTNIDGDKFLGILMTENQDKENEFLYVDFGMDSDEELIENTKIQVGDMITFKSDYTDLNNERFLAKALDDRLGVYCLLELIDQDLEVSNNIYYVFTSSEEVGCRGAKTITSIMNLDYAFVIDVGCAHSEFDRSYKNNRQIGKGPMIINYDRSMIPNYRFLNEIKTIIKDSNISYQNDMFMGGTTDGAHVHMSNSGIKTINLALPTRYGHGPYSIASKTDLESMIKLLNKIEGYQWEK